MDSVKIRINMPEEYIVNSCIPSTGALNKIIRYAEGSSTDLINIDKKMSHGIYQLQIIKPGNKMIVNRIMY